mmetsp:Transcript_38808/g.124401  ORF Transcript_38808/g.124401 Transcript_38808/m.124401 type:complete len:472 (+) Transcript_38808:107-1522(+)
MSVSNSTIRRNDGSNDSGFADVWQGSTLTATSSQFLENSAGDYGGVAFVDFGSTFDATNSSFDRNHAGVHGGAVLLLVSAKFTATNASFTRNQAGQRGGVAFAYYSANFTVTNSSFEANQCGTDGAVAFVYRESTFLSSRAKFTNNIALRNGGVALLGDSSTFSTANSSFEASKNAAAADGDIIYMSQASTVELDEASLRGYGENSIRCWGTGTTYVSSLDVELSRHLFALDANCVLFLYQTNNDGSEEFRDAVKQSELVDFSRATVNFVHWSYPCGAGRWSSDGIAHGNTPAFWDVHNNSIDENDPFCDDDVRTNLPECSASCRTCPGGKYLGFTLNRYLHLGETACSDCKTTCPHFDLNFDFRRSRRPVPRRRRRRLVASRRARRLRGVPPREIRERTRRRRVHTLPAGHLRVGERLHRVLVRRSGLFCRGPRVDSREVQAGHVFRRRHRVLSKLLRRRISRQVRPGVV